MNKTQTKPVFFMPDQILFLIVETKNSRMPSISPEHDSRDVPIHTILAFQSSLWMLTDFELKEKKNMQKDLLWDTTRINSNSYCWMLVVSSRPGRSQRLLYKHRCN